LGVRCLEQEPNSALGLVNPSFQQARGCSITLIITKGIDVDSPVGCGEMANSFHLSAIAQISVAL
jgi:hypothetical protein